MLLCQAQASFKRETRFGLFSITAFGSGNAAKIRMRECADARKTGALRFSQT